jgi:hypothetical protein
VRNDSQVRKRNTRKIGGIASKRDANLGGILLELFQEVLCDFQLQTKDLVGSLPSEQRVSYK